MRTTALAVALSLVAGVAHGACASSGVAGKWSFKIRRGAIIYRCPDVTITSAGAMTGNCSAFDPDPAAFTLRSTTPVRVAANCQLSGEFTLSHPQQTDGYAIRGAMNRSMDTMGMTPFAWPNFTHAIWMDGYKQ